MIFSLEQILRLIIDYRYFIIFPIVVIEGPIITIMGGFLSSLGVLNPFITYGVVILGDLVADILYYSFGRWGRKGLINRWGRYIGITAESVSKLEKHFNNNSAKTLILGKISQGIGGVILVTAGIVKMPFWRFLWYNVVATVPKSLVLLLIGFYFGQTYVKFSRYLDYTALITIALAILFTVIYIIMKRTSKKYVDPEVA